MAVSQNGWPVNPPRRKRTVPGTNVGIVVADGPAGDVLMYVASQFDKRVEDIDNADGMLDDWGWADRPIRGSAETSNHASATAIDLNAPRHPLGVAGTFSPRQVHAIHQILTDVGHVVRWGGDYTGRVDEMHFEINAGYDAVKRVADRLNSPVPAGGGSTSGGQTAAQRHYQRHPEDAMARLYEGYHIEYFVVPEGAKRVVVSCPTGVIKARIIWHGPEYPDGTNSVGMPHYDWVAPDSVHKMIHRMRPWRPLIPEAATGFDLIWTFTPEKRDYETQTAKMAFTF